MELDYGKIALLMIAWLAFKETVPGIASYIVYFLYEIVYYAIKREHSVYYWRDEEERITLRDICTKRDKRNSGKENKTIGFRNDEIKS